MVSIGNRKNKEPQNTQTTILHKPEKPSTENLDLALKEMLGKANKKPMENRKAKQLSSMETTVDIDHFVLK
jgi:hypothetical protein